MKSILTTFLFLVSICITAQTKSFLYKGNIDKLPITLYLEVSPNECTGDNYYNAMYKYDTMNNWIELNVNEGKNNQFAMVEENFTGLMIVKRLESTIIGTWMSPDNKKQLPVNLKSTTVSKTEKEKYSKALEELNYSNHDC